MNFTRFAARFALMVACVLVTAPIISAPAQARAWQCVPYARMISGVDIRGNAHTWWSQAAGKYERGDAPREGAVLSFASSRRMPLGHVAMVSRVINDREVLLTHANWSRRGQIETNVRAVDVSAAGDWSQVKVWYGPTGDLGTSSNPANGFIYPGEGSVEAQDEPVANVVIASAAPVPVALKARAEAFTLDLQ